MYSKKSKEKKQCRKAITFAGVCENGVGMEKIGDERPPVTPEAMAVIVLKLLAMGIKCKVYDLKENIVGEHNPPPKHGKYLLLHVPCFVQKVLSEETLESLNMSLNQIEWDRQKLNPRTKKVCNSHARENNCFADSKRKADIPQGKGTIHSFHDLPKLKQLRELLGHIMGSDYENLNAEGNKYTQGILLNGERKPTPKGIGWHGDTERNVVACVSFGDWEMPLHFAWYHKFKQIENQRPFHINVGHGDLYIMGEGVVGNDWKKSSQLTVRHAAGDPKYTKYVAKKAKEPQKRKRKSPFDVQTQGNVKKPNVKHSFAGKSPRKWNKLQLKEALESIQRRQGRIRKIAESIYIKLGHFSENFERFKNDEDMQKFKGTWRTAHSLCKSIRTALHGDVDDTYSESSSEPGSVSPQEKI